MHRDFDDFYDMDGDHIRHQHFNDLDHDQYGEDYDPNSESFYDLDTFSLDYAKSLFFGKSQGTLFTYLLTTQQVKYGKAMGY